ncbi:hypothetical protein, partial [Pseudoalteromonas ruthenica]|uniref:hypothetical protein n=1 Tax=Pseudoalteromonas ruthenica TaxID=151081 RepID=UPI00241CCB09
LVDMTDSKSVAFGRGGSSPPTGTTFDNPSRLARVFLCLKFENYVDNSGINLAHFLSRNSPFKMGIKT